MCWDSNLGGEELDEVSPGPVALLGDEGGQADSATPVLDKLSAHRSTSKVRTSRIIGSFDGDDESSLFVETEVEDAAPSQLVGGQLVPGK